MSRDFTPVSLTGGFYSRLRHESGGRTRSRAERADRRASTSAGPIAYPDATRYGYSGMSPNTPEELSELSDELV